MVKGIDGYTAAPTEQGVTMTFVTDPKAINEAAEEAAAEVVKVLCHVDWEHGFETKPKGKVIGGIQERFKTAHFEELPLERVVQAIETGHTIALADCTDRKKEGFRQANALPLDFDNGHSSAFDKSMKSKDYTTAAEIVRKAITGGEIITQNEVRERCRQYGFAEPLIYNTFSHRAYLDALTELEAGGHITESESETVRAAGTFRAMWVFSETVTDLALYEDLCGRFRAIYPESDSSFNIAGLAFGTRDPIPPQNVTYTDITTIPTLQPAADEVQAVQQTELDKPFTFSGTGSTSNKNNSGYTADRQRENIRSYLQYIPPSQLTDKEWLNIGNAMKTEGFSYTEFDEWSRSGGDTRYNERVNRRRWDSLEVGKCTGSTICKIAKRFGWTSTKSAKSGNARSGNAGSNTEEQELYNWNLDQWREFFYECYPRLKEAFECSNNCAYVFRNLYLSCMSNGLLTNKGRLPKYLHPKIRDQKCVGFTINIPPFAESLREDFHIINIATNANTTGAMYVYDPCGKYNDVSIEEERGIIHKRLEMFDNEGHIWNTKTIKDTSFLFHCPHETKTLDDFNADEDIINFQNGIYNIKTGELLPHTHEVLSTVQLPLDYDPKAADRPTPAFDSMLNHLSGGRDDVKQLILQFSAAIISNIDMGNLKSFLMIYGARDSGKSQLFNLLSQFLGENNFCNTSMTLLAENRFEPYNLYGKRLAGRAELNVGEVVKHHSKIKELTGGDYTRAEIKCGGTFSFRFKGGLLFTSNERPILENADEAFYTRLRLIYVEQSLQYKDPLFMEKLLDERQAIAMKLLPLIQKIKESGTIIDPVSSIALKKEYRAENDPVIDFFVNHCEMSDRRDETTLFSRVYSLYKNWAGKCYYDIVSAKKFSATLDNYIKREGLTRGKFDRYGKPLGATVQGAGRKTYCTFEVIPDDWTFSAISIKSEDKNPKK